MAEDRLGAFVTGPGLMARGQPGGALAGARFAAKDLFDVAGQRTGAGNPDWLADAPVAASHAPAVAALLAAGADLWGKTVTDELAFSLSGTNVHYGTPLNPRAPGRVPGGSSSGSASAVAGGAVELALGTDTAGSVRVPASYCGIFGLRPTHGVIDATGVTPLAPSFDTVGLLAGEGPLLARAWRALSEGAGTSALARQERPLRRLVLADDLMSVADGPCQAVLGKAAGELSRRLGLALDSGLLGAPGQLDRWRDAFRAMQLAEVWQVHGSWVSSRKPRFGPGVAERFASAADAGARPEEAKRAQPARAEVLQAIRQLVGEDGVLVQPAAVGPAPVPVPDRTVKSGLRGRTLLLTTPAGLAGCPVVVLPLASFDGFPVGLALVGLPGEDDALVGVAARL